MTNRPEKPTVIFISTVFEHVNTGPAIYTRYLWDALSKDQDIDFHLVAPDSNCQHEKFHSVQFEGRSVDNYKSLQRAALNLARNFSSPPIIHSNNAHSIWKLASYQGPVIAQVNDYDAAEAFQNILTKINTYGPRRVASLIWRRKNEKAAISFADRIVCNSKFTKRRLAAAYGEQRMSKAEVIYKAVDINHFSGSDPLTNKNRFDLLDGKKVLFLGANWRRKGLDLAIKAIASINNIESPINLLIAGKRNQNADLEIQALPKILGISERVQFLGPVTRENLPALMQQCDLLVLPSREEALGVALLEGLASGLPVIGTSVGGIPEVIDGMNYSKLVPPGNPKALANAIMDVIFSLKRTEEIRDESRARAAKFSKQIMLTNIKSLYNTTSTRSS